MEFKGILKGCVVTRSGDSANGHWERRQYLVAQVASFPKKMVFEISDGETGRYAKWDALVGKTVCVRFTIDASEYNGRWYNNVMAWDIWEPSAEAAGDTAGAVVAAQKAAEGNTKTITSNGHPFDELQGNGTNGDGLPF